MFNSLHGHSMYSLLDGLSSIEKLVSTYKSLGYKAAALTDHRTISGCVKFYKECKKQGIKPILGCEFDVTEGSASLKNKENPTGHLVVLAKNLNGWKGLITCVSKSNDEENFYFRPRVDLEMLSEFKDDLIVISGHPGSTFGNIFIDKSVYRCKNQDDVYSFIRGDFDEYLNNLLEKYQNIFGDNFFLEVQQFDRNPVQNVLAEVIRDLSERTGTPKVATLDVHYALQEDAKDQRLILCSSINKTFKEVYKLMSTGDFGLEGFFKTDAYYIHPPENVEQWHTTDEIENTQKIVDLIEDFDILKKPVLPKYSDDELNDLKKLCQIGWDKKLSHLTDKQKEYKDRLDEEFSVIEEAGLAGYFLIVQDYCNWYKDHGGLLGPGRGSAAGCLVSYLIGITEIDPIKYGLVFERFYNKARAGSLPDIDCDFEKGKREEVIEYLKEKYGQNNVSHMATFGRLMGRGALKEVMRINGAASPSEINKITKNIPDEAKIADELADMDEKSIILWSLINDKDKLSEWCTYKDGEFSGPLAQYFEQAVSIEGTFKSQGKHAAGIIISNENLNQICPMVRDKSGEKNAGFEMGDLEDIGQVKMDLLGVQSLNRLTETNKLIRELYE